jgi:hypothetical protein
LTGLGELLLLGELVLVGDGSLEVAWIVAGAPVSVPFVHPDARMHTLATTITHGRAVSRTMRLMLAQ